MQEVFPSHYLRVFVDDVHLLQFVVAGEYGYDGAVFHHDARRFDLIIQYHPTALVRISDVVARHVGCVCGSLDLT
jgi:hypothetical protein